MNFMLAFACNLFR